MSALLAPSTAPPALAQVSAAPAQAEGASSRTASRAGRARRPVYLRPVASPAAGQVQTAVAAAPAPLVSLPERPPRATPVQVRSAGPFDDIGADVTPLRSLTGPATDPGRVCASILQIAGEAMRGLRPLVQLARWIDDDIFRELAAFAPSHGSRTSVRQRLDPGSAATVLARGQLRKVRVARITPHVAECTVLTEIEGRVRAVVVRLEERGTTWRATALAAV